MSELPCNRLKNVKARANRARNFPHNTCPASRHLQFIADYLSSAKATTPLELVWDREHLAGTMYSVLESLWKARAEKSRE